MRTGKKEKSGGSLLKNMLGELEICMQREGEKEKGHMYKEMIQGKKQEISRKMKCQDPKKQYRI